MNEIDFFRSILALACIAVLGSISCNRTATPPLNQVHATYGPFNTEKGEYYAMVYYEARSGAIVMKGPMVFYSADTEAITVTRHSPGGRFTIRSKSQANRSASAKSGVFLLKSGVVVPIGSVWHEEFLDNKKYRVDFWNESVKTHLE